MLIAALYVGFAVAAVECAIRPCSWLPPRPPRVAERQNSPGESLRDGCPAGSLSRHGMRMVHLVELGLAFEVGSGPTDPKRRYVVAR